MAFQGVDVHFFDAALYLLATIAVVGGYLLTFYLHHVRRPPAPAPVVITTFTLAFGATATTALFMAIHITSHGVVFHQLFGVALLAHAFGLVVFGSYTINPHLFDDAAAWVSGDNGSRMFTRPAGDHSTDAETDDPPAERSD